MTKLLKMQNYTLHLLHVFLPLTCTAPDFSSPLSRLLICGKHRLMRTVQWKHIVPTGLGLPLLLMLILGITSAALRWQPLWTLCFLTPPPPLPNSAHFYSLHICQFPTSFPILPCQHFVRYIFLCYQYPVLQLGQYFVFCIWYNYFSSLFPISQPTLCWSKFFIHMSAPLNVFFSVAVQF